MSTRLNKTLPVGKGRLAPRWPHPGEKPAPFGTDSGSVPDPKPSPPSAAHETCPCRPVLREPPRRPDPPPGALCSESDPRTTCPLHKVPVAFLPARGREPGGGPGLPLRGPGNAHSPGLPARAARAAPPGTGRSRDRQHFSGPSSVTAETKTSPQQDAGCIGPAVRKMPRGVETSYCLIQLAHRRRMFLSLPSVLDPDSCLGHIPHT